MSRSSLAFDDAHEVRDLGDHAPHCRRVFEGRTAADLVETETDQRARCSEGGRSGFRLLDGERSWKKP
jgi:hypothetical protein